MSVRARLISAIFLALLIGFSLSAAISAWQAAREVRVEVTAALRGARQGTWAAVAALPAGPAGERALRRLVSVYDGNRHVGAALLDAAGGVVAASRPAAAPAVPRWFLRLVAPALRPVVAEVAGVPGIAAVRLAPDAAQEAAERWTELRGRLAGFALFFILSAGLCSLVAARSLRPLTDLARGLAQIGHGETPGPLPAAGPAEVARLARAFNDMAAALAGAEARNRQLADQVARVAEEERAEIARDLHDEVGPLLFAIGSFAAALESQIAPGPAGVPPQLAAIRDAVAQLQLQVRDMLGWLRHGEAAVTDLPRALRETLEFWRGLAPGTAFTLAVEGETGLVAPAAREALFRVAQEAVSNAMRHGRPASIEVRLGVSAHEAVLQVRDDGAGGPEGSGFGLTGMRARMAALGGSLTVERGPGWTVTGRVPGAAAPVAA